MIGSKNANIKNDVVLGCFLGLCQTISNWTQLDLTFYALHKFIDLCNSRAISPNEQAKITEMMLSPHTLVAFSPITLYENGQSKNCQFIIILEEYLKRMVKRSSIVDRVYFDFLQKAMAASSNREYQDVAFSSFLWFLYNSMNKPCKDATFSFYKPYLQYFISHLGSALKKDEGLNSSLGIFIQAVDLKVHNHAEQVSRAQIFNQFYSALSSHLSGSLTMSEDSFKQLSASVYANVPEELEKAKKIFSIA